ncbi:MAG: myo-inosose-2 dehydratase [Terracidiphilus sp.]|jgi:inosose dehydratase
MTNTNAKPFNPDKVWVGITPTSWWNDDFLDIDIGIPFGQCVSEMALAGYAGCSVGHKYPTDTAVLTKELDQRGLRVSEPWTSTYFTIHEMHGKTIANFRTSLAFIKAMKGTDVVVAEMGGSSHQQPIALIPNRPIFTDQQWDLLTNGLNEIGQIAADAGMRLCYHHHMGTGVMIRSDVDRLMASTDPKLVHLLLDTGHIYYAGGDPLALARDYATRIKHVHLKNIRLPILKKALAEQLSFKEAILAGIFTVPGDPDGGLEFAPILQALADKDYAGWLVVEAEQNPANANPLHYATMGRKYMRDVIGI